MPGQTTAGDPTLAEKTNESTPSLGVYPAHPRGQTQQVRTRMPCARLTPLFALDTSFALVLGLRVLLVRANVQVLFGHALASKNERGVGKCHSRFRRT